MGESTPETRASPDPYADAARQAVWQFYAEEGLVDFSAQIQALPGAFSPEHVQDTERFKTCYKTDSLPALCLAEVIDGRSAYPDTDRQEFMDYIRPWRRLPIGVTRGLDELIVYADHEKVPYSALLAVMNGMRKFGFENAADIIAHVEPKVLITQMKCVALLTRLNQLPQPSWSHTQIMPERVRQGVQAMPGEIITALKNWEITPQFLEGRDFRNMTFLAQYNNEKNHVEFFTVPSLFEPLDNLILFHELFHAWQDLRDFAQSAAYAERDAYLASQLMVIRYAQSGGSLNQELLEAVFAEMDEESVKRGASSLAQSGVEDLLDSTPMMGIMEGVEEIPDIPGMVDPDRTARETAGMFWPASGATET
ncbi:MAG: hypothetical protein HY541_07280, partial [Deltaproteobacteria bacterium]|nr:hypothetical protein [Deltaproteobacteria bacterium]